MSIDHFAVMKRTRLKRESEEVLLEMSLMTQLKTVTKRLLKIKYNKMR